jgi:hypothetical protein
MPKTVNLNKVRKQKAREAEARRAAVNRAIYGRTKAEKALEVAEKEREARLMDGMELETPED